MLVAPDEIGGMSRKMLPHVSDDKVVEINNLVDKKTMSFDLVINNNAATEDPVIAQLKFYLKEILAK